MERLREGCREVERERGRHEGGEAGMQGSR